MRELKVIGLDVDGKHIICEGDDPSEKFKLRADERLRAAVRGDAARIGQTEIEIEASNMLRPKEIQARIRAGASVEQVAAAAGVDVERVERFAHPVLLERSRAAELATAAHPVLADGPAVMTLLETVTSALLARGLNPDNTNWDAWRNEDGRWTVQLAWKAGRSDNVAHFCFTPGAHGDGDRPRRCSQRAHRPKLQPPAAATGAGGRTRLRRACTLAPAGETEHKHPPARSRRGKPPVPAWEDVLLGVRSSGQR